MHSIKVQDSLKSNLRFQTSTATATEFATAQSAVKLNWKQLMMITKKQMRYMNVQKLSTAVWKQTDWLLSLMINYFFFAEIWKMNHNQQHQNQQMMTFTLLTAWEISYSEQIYRKIYLLMTAQSQMQMWDDCTVTVTVITFQISQHHISKIYFVFFQTVTEIKITLITLHSFMLMLSNINICFSDWNN